MSSIVPLRSIDARASEETPEAAVFVPLTARWQRYVSGGEKWPAALDSGHAENLRDCFA